MDEKNNNLESTREISNERGIHNDMDTLEITKSMCKGTWILGKRAATMAKEMVAKMKEQAEELKNNKKG